MKKKYQFLVIITVFLAVVFGGCQETPSIVTPAGISEEFKINENGGVLNAINAPVSIAFMGNALSTNTTITVKTASSLPSDSKYIDGTAYDFGPNGITFAQPVQLTIGYDPTKIPTEINEGTLRLAKLVDNQWQILSESWVNTTTHSVSGIITGFSSYCVRGNNVKVSIDPPSATCIPGGSVQLESSVEDVPEDLLVYYNWGCSGNYGDVFTNNNGMDALYLANGNAVNGATDAVTLILTINFGLSAVYVKGEDGIEDWFYDKTDTAVLGVAHATVTIQEFSFSIEPASAKCAAGGNIGFEVISNGLPNVENTIEYRWSCSNLYGNFFTDAPDDSAIEYTANENVPDDSTDYIKVEIWAHYNDGSSKKLGESTATVTIGSVNLKIDYFPSSDYDIPLLDVRGSGRITMEAKLTNRPTGELLYVWDVGGDNTEGMLGGFGEQLLQHYEDSDDSIYFKSSGIGADGIIVTIYCSVYQIVNGERQLLEKASTKFEIYMPSQIYSLCGSPTGDISPRLGSGSSWSFYVVDHGPIYGGSFFARPGDKLRIYCNYKGYMSEYLTYDIYIRLGYVEDPPSSTQLIVSQSEIVDGLDKTVAISIY